MSDKTEKHESDNQTSSNSALNDMAKDYISMWQQQWVATMTDPKTQDTLKELYQTMAVMYDKNKEVLFECTEALKRKNDIMEQQYNEAKRAQESSEPDVSNSQEDGTAAVYATLEQCVGLLGQLNERLTSLEGRINKLEQSTSGKTGRKSSK